MGFQQRADAVRFLEEFKERLAKFGLELHPDKTRLIEFGRYAARDRKRRGEGKPETFTFLGFTHYCGRRHKTETFTVWRITAKRRMAAKLKAIKVELQRRKHDRTSQVGAWLRKVVIRLLPIPCCSRQHRPAAHLQESRQSALAERSGSPQSNARGRSGRSLLRSSKGGYHHPTSCILTLKHASTPLILHKSRMRRRARTDLSGGRSVMSVPTGSGDSFDSRSLLKGATIPVRSLSL